jgi:hypothetical protein
MGDINFAANQTFFLQETEAGRAKQGHSCERNQLPYRIIIGRQPLRTCMPSLTDREVSVKARRSHAQSICPFEEDDEDEEHE